MKKVAVIGGGITGLSTAYYLHKIIRERKLAAEIVLIEADERLGGKIHTVKRDGFIMEVGADSLVARKRNVDPLIDELGLREEVVYNATGKSYLHADGKLKLIPEDAVFGIPLSLQALAESGLISAEGKVEALKDFYTTNETFTKNDSIGLFLEAFLGKEIVEKQIAPVLSGVYSGKLNELTIASTLPYLLDYKNQHGSIMKGLAENRQTFKSQGEKKFLSFAGGTSAIIERMEQALSEIEWIKGCKVSRVIQDGKLYTLDLQDGRSLVADSVVLSVPHQAAQSMLANENLNEDFAELIGSSLISVYMGFDVSDELLPENGTGFIVADSSGLKCQASTWTSRKWSHTSTNHQLLVRLFYKSSGPHYERLQGLSEEEMLQEAMCDLQQSIGQLPPPTTYAITRWTDAMPNYHLRHHEVVQSLERKVAQQYPGLFLAGCSYYGVGIPDCIANGEATAARVAELL